jgi:hypothetical protein
MTRPPIQGTSDLLNAIAATDMRADPYFAVCFFAGVRPEAAMKLKWTEICNSGSLYVPDTANKSGHAYNVAIQPALDLWLAWKKSQGKSPLEDFRTMASTPPHASSAPKTKYTNAEGAREHLGISKSKFFRLRNQGYFKPSPVTGLYHLDDLDREARGIRQPSPYEQQASQKFSEDPKTNLHWLQVREGATQEAKSKRV